MHDVTITMTIGRRPELLEQTLKSLGHILPHYRVLAVNDFGRDAESEVFEQCCSHGELFDLAEPLGHHAALDLIYGKIESTYVFQCEDDWLFDQQDFIDQSCDALDHLPQLSSVCLRQISDMPQQFQTSPHLEKVETEWLDYLRLDGAHRHWHGFTFNPHLARTKLWQSVGPFSTYRKERHISMRARKMGMHVAYAAPGFCHHIGYEATVTEAHPNFWQRLWQKIG